MIKAIIIKRLAATVFTFAVTAVVPFLLNDRPVLAKAWGQFGPVIVDAAQGQMDDVLDKLD